MLKRTKAIMILTVAFWGLVGAFHNIIGWDGAIRSVGTVTSMISIDGGVESWKATSNPLVIWMGAFFITISKLATGVLCSIGAVGMWRAQGSDLSAYITAKDIALTGCAISIIMLFGGFFVIAEGWFELWRSKTMSGPILLSSFRYAGMITLIAIFVASKE